MASVPANGTGRVAGMPAVPGLLPPTKEAQRQPVKLDVVSQVMERHYRDEAQDSKLEYSPAWKDAKIAIRFMNHMSPLMLGIIQRPGSQAPIEHRKSALNFMLASADALSKVMSEKLATTPLTTQYDRLELNSMLAHLIGKIWEKSSTEDEQTKVDELLRTVTAVYADPEFAARHEKAAEFMMNKVGYLRVESPEDMNTRLRISMHQAALRFYEAVTDERLGNGKGAFFTFGLKKSEVVREMMVGFDKVVEGLLSNAAFSASLSNDQRTAIMQSWIRHASEIYRAEYTVSTIRVMDWFRAGQQVSKEEFENRYARACTMLHEAIEKSAAVTHNTMSELFSAAGLDGIIDRPACTDHPAPAG